MGGIGWRFTKWVASEPLGTCKEKRKDSVYKELGHPLSGPAGWKPEAVLTPDSGHAIHALWKEALLLELGRGSGSGTCETVQTEITQYPSVE